MKLAHLGLPVTDVDRSLAFYAAHFGFDRATARHYPDHTVIVSNAEAFDLALHPVAQRAVLPEFLHFGFQLDAPEAVRERLSHLRALGVPILETDDEPGYVAFKCADPDGHRIEIYWEPRVES